MTFAHWCIVGVLTLLCGYTFVRWWRRKPLTPEEKAEQERIENDLAQW